MWSSINLSETFPKHNSLTEDLCNSVNLQWQNPLFTGDSSSFIPEPRLGPDVQGLKDFSITEPTEIDMSRNVE